MAWVLLVPEGVEVNVVPGAKVERPTLVTSERILAIAETVAKMLEAGIEVDAAELLRREVGSVPASPVAIPLDARDNLMEFRIVDPISPPVDGRQWACECGATYSVRTGGEVALRGHRATCGLYQGGVLIPEDRRVD